MSSNSEYIAREIAKAADTSFASAEAEKHLLGCFVKKFDACLSQFAELAEDDFFFASHRTIFKAMRQARAEQLNVDLVTLNQMLFKIAPHEEQKLTEEVVECVKPIFTTGFIDSYLTIVKTLSTRRKAIALCEQMRRQLADPAQDINAIMDKMRTEAGDISVGKHSWVSMQDGMLATFEYLEQRVKGTITSITTGIKNVDAVIGGFFGGELTVIGARPAVGKSVFGMNVALAAAEQGFHVGICSREMTNIQYGQRILSYESYVDGMKLRKAEVSDDDWNIIAEGLGEASRLPIEFLFTVRTVEDLRAEVQRKAHRGELDMLIVDYLQLMATAQRFKEDRLRVGYISKALKDIAVDYNIPVIALAQVKRYAGGARAKMPTLEDLKDSGNIEQDADGVIFLHNPYDEEDDYVDPRDKPHFRDYIEKGYTYLCLGIAKQRQGSTGKACVLFDKRTMHYYAIDRSGREEQGA